MMKKIEVSVNDTIESVVYTLLAAKARGEQAYCVFKGHEFYSDTVNMEDAIKEMQDEDNDGHWKEQAAREERERGYAEKVQKSRDSRGADVVSLENVLAGMKFIAENQSIDHEELVDGLLSRNCNFTQEDIEEQFPNMPKMKLFKGMRKADLACGASVIASFRDHEFGRAYCEEAFLSVDDRTSVYHYIRVATRRLKFKKLLAAFA